MTDEAGVLLRVSIFGFVAGIVYWFLSLRVAGHGLPADCWAPGRASPA